MQRRLYIDETHTALDIFRFAVFLSLSSFLESISFLRSSFLKLSIFVIQKATASKNGDGFFQKSIGAIRYSLAYMVRHCSPYDQSANPTIFTLMYQNPDDLPATPWCFAITASQSERICYLVEPDGLPGLKTFNFMITCCK